ncbi:circularly permuted type 2 ATP-grasp protein [Alkalicoccus chagannorensis]|uniref:circularly permuted type 2 ATP-grasp protein n=1 Tax=Alkalicoccus chagannorensis TaxID=427072 RepID=UPI0004260A45|nr:circularly permuted type 2 ATP-grasp protein [Alkalicoccus chagannorensis]
MLKNYPVSSFYDEMMKEAGQARPHYEKFHRLLHSMEMKELHEKHETAQLSFLRQGITFTVYHEEGGTERTMPFDFVPIIIPDEDWERIEAGIKQRVRALNHFLEDVYQEREIIHDRIVPREVVENNQYFYEQQASGLKLPHNNHIFLAGIDLIRDNEGTYRVLEDNLRNPSGLSYVFQNRFVMRKVFPELFFEHDIWTLEHQMSRLHQALLSHVPVHAPNPDNPTAVLLTAGMYNSAYYDHVFLAQQMGIELVEGQDLLVKDDVVFMKTVRGLKRVDIIYRRIDDDFLDPEVFSPDSEIGVAGLMRAVEKGNAAVLNAVGNGVADDKEIYAYVPEMIRYYLGEDPLIPNVDTYFLRDKETRDDVLQRLDELVIKNVGASGGYDMLIGPQSTAEQREQFRRQIEAKPEQYIAQPTIQLSRAPAFQQQRFYPCHVDLRVYAVGSDDIHVLPGGLSRVALKEGSLVVNSSQGGGGKDTWVMRRGGPQHAE